MLRIKDTQDGFVFKIRVQPKSAKNAVAGLYGDSLKLKITAPPVEGAANQQCIAFLSKQLGLPKSDLEIIAGHTGRDKFIKLMFPPETPSTEKRKLRQRILSLIS